MKSLLPLFCVFFLACSQAPRNTSVQPLNDSGAQLYSQVGQERKVSFEALYHTSLSQIEDLPSAEELSEEIHWTTQYLFGPLVMKELGGPQKGEKITPQIEKAKIENGRVVVPYLYEAVWLISAKGIRNSTLKLPLPYSMDELQETDWKACTDSEPEHQTADFLWYFWEPSRPGCTHKLGKDYQEVKVKLGEATVQTKLSYPEYQRMIHLEDGKPVLAMTFAFGYVSDPAVPNIFKDRDEGIREFQKFHSSVEKSLKASGFQSRPLLQKDFGGMGEGVIGTEFTGTLDGLQYRVSVVAAAGIDQMDLFAWSYAHKHEAVFGWFGHSRVGSGFDAERFRRMTLFRADQYSVSSDYQLVYWAGCNSYSYYTQPFFDLKAQQNPQADPKGTKNLDLISNGLPSLFAFYSTDANILFKAVMNWKTQTSYQSLIKDIEKEAASWSSKVIVNILGDEDNPALN